MMEKTCTKCGVTLSVEMFPWHDKEKRRKHAHCKECRRKYYRDYRENNRVEIAARNEKYYKENKDKIAEQAREYRKTREAKEADGHYKETMAEWYRAYYKNYRLEHKDYYRNKKKIWKKNAANKIEYRLREALRKRIQKVLKGQSKSGRTAELLGCSIEQFKNYVASLFTEGMTWDNYGEWHIDHIKPCASFDLSVTEQQRECFNYKNLQPLWAEDNLRKGAKYAGRTL